MLKRNIILFPVWFFELFTRGKSFRNNPIIGSQILNRCGLHIFRTLVSRLIYHCRQNMLFFMASDHDKAEFRQNGFIVKENFLPADEFQGLVTEINRYDGDAWESIQGDTITQHVFLDQDNPVSLEKCNGFINQPEFLRLLKWCAGKSSYPRFFIQRIMNRFATGEVDPQKSLHSDTFHPSVKCWFFLEDVAEQDGPFTYVAGSHRLTWKRLVWEYKKSCIAKTLNDGHSEDGSFRIDGTELQSLGLGKAKSFAVKKNTLVIANVYGFHCRGDALNKGVRKEIFGFFRPNPFNPFPGIDLIILRRLKMRLIKKYFCYQDRKARKQGNIAFWHQVKPADQETES